MRPENVVLNQAIEAAIAAYKDGIGAIYALFRRPEKIIDGETTHES